MQYGDKKMETQYLSAYFGELQPAPFNSRDSNPGKDVEHQTFVSQRDAELFYFHRKVEKAPIGSAERTAAQKRLDDEQAKRRKVDTTMEKLVSGLYGGLGLHTSTILSRETHISQPVVDDWECLESLVRFGMPLFLLNHLHAE